MTVRFLLLLVIAAAAVVLTSAREAPVDGPQLPEYLTGVPAPLATAVHRLTQDSNRWAYTQRSLNYDRRGNVDDEVVVRFDPSRHYDEQWTLLTRNGEPATAKEIEKYRKDRAKRGKDRKSLGELLDLRAATVVDETAECLVYDVPLSSENNDRLPPEKFLIRIAVRQPAHVLESIELSLRSALRVAVIAKVKDAGAVLRFSTVDPKHSPTLVSIEASGKFSVMFVSISDSYQLARTDFRRVKPYDERFGVTIGPMKVIDF